LKSRVLYEKRLQQNVIALKLEIINAFTENLNLRMDDLLIENQEIDHLKNYFYTLELMICCKEAAVRVSPQVWAGIEARMVTVPE
jgi:hypothetical protein